ncbi:hypothetical protein ACJX0J_033111 [Zea mays]
MPQAGQIVQNVFLVADDWGVAKGQAYDTVSLSVLAVFHTNQSHFISWLAQCAMQQFSKTKLTMGAATAIRIGGLGSSLLYPNFQFSLFQIKDSISPRGGGGGGGGFRKFQKGFVELVSQLLTRAVTWQKEYLPVINNNHYDNQYVKIVALLVQRYAALGTFFFLFLFIYATKRHTTAEKATPSYQIYMDILSSESERYNNNFTSIYSNFVILSFRLSMFLITSMLSFSFSLRSENIIIIAFDVRIY